MKTGKERRQGEVRTQAIMVETNWGVETSCVMGTDVEVIRDGKRVRRWEWRKK